MKLGNVKYIGTRPERIIGGKQTFSFQASSEALKIPVGAVLSLASKDLRFRARLESQFGEKTILWCIGSGSIQPQTILEIHSIQLSGECSNHRSQCSKRFVLSISKQIELFQRTSSGYVRIDQPENYSFRDSLSGQTLTILRGKIYPQVVEITCRAPIIPKKTYFIHESTTSSDTVLIFDPSFGKVSGRKRKVENSSVLDLESPVALVPERSYLAL